jgi:hypothetical protein
MRTDKRRISCSCGEITSPTHSDKTMGINRNGFYRTVPRSRQIQLLMGSDLQDVVNGTFDTSEYQDDGNTAVVDIHEGSGKATWPTIVDCIQSRSKIHVKMVA